MFTDIRFNLIERLPAPLRPYALLMRLDRPAGIFLLLLPALQSIALATRPHHVPDIMLMALFALGAVAMRGAGCIVNDLFDRELDARVERTALRPLAKGDISPRAAIIFAILLTCIGLAIVLAVNTQTLYWAAASLPLIIIYPLMKRFTWWPQAFLGLVFNWGALLGYVAVNGEIETPALWLYAACFFWTLAYDTTYAFQDVRDDEVVGIKSTARLLGPRGRRWVAAWYGLFILLLCAAGAAARLGLGFYIGMAIAALEIAHQFRFWRLESPATSLKAFKSNVLIGWIVLAAILAGQFQ